VRPSLTVAAVLTALAVAATGCSTSAARTQASPDLPAVLSSPSVVPEPSVEAAESAEPSESSAPSPTASPTPEKPAFVYDVAAAQRKLTELRYYVGVIDGARGPALRSAVMAFQKVQGLGADGTIGPVTLAALKTPRTPVLRGAAPADRVEIDLTKQVLYVVKRGVLSRIMPVSSGNGATYLQKDGGKAKALTPTGYYRIQRRIVGERVADLGTLYDPQYFYRGWAIHGSNSVPARPASHGCVRVTRTDAKYLLNALKIGMSVYLYGGAFTFTAGSAAPGTDNPTGDTAADTAPSPTPRATQPTQPTPSPTSTDSGEASESPAASPSPSPSPSG